MPQKNKILPSNEKEHERISLNGYKKVMEQHTMEERFLDILTKIQ